MALNRSACSPDQENSRSPYQSCHQPADWTSDGYTTEYRAQFGAQHVIEGLHNGLIRPIVGMASSIKPIVVSFMNRPDSGCNHGTAADG